VSDIKNSQEPSGVIISPTQGLSNLGVEPEKLLVIAENREAFRMFSGLLPL